MPKSFRKENYWWELGQARNLAACKNNRKSDSRGSGAVLWTTSDSDDTHLSLESSKQEVSMSPFCCKVKKKPVIGVDISTGVRMLRYLTRAIASKPSNID